jgi:hypothetical protein
LLPERSVQVHDLLVEVVLDDHVEGADRAAAVSGATIGVLFSLKPKIRK